MSFLFPFFLLAGLALAIPVLIHLFNLRRYKTVYFPHTRFLKSIQLQSQKQSRLRYKWLLAARLLFLAMLVLAFAQPFFNTASDGKTDNSLQVIYIDNSYSMSVKLGARSLLDVAKETARKQVQQSPPGARFLLLTNDKPPGYQPQPADKVLAAISAIDISAQPASAQKLLGTVQQIRRSEATEGASVYYYSDFQRNTFTGLQQNELLRDVQFYGVPIQAATVQNVFIDTAFLTMPVLQVGEGNQLIVRSRAVGKQPAEAPVLQLRINGQVKSAATLRFDEKGESTDTLGLQVNETGWQQMQLTITDAAVQFDDTFRVSARSIPGLSILVLNEGQPNPYIQAAFRSYSGFRVTQEDVNNAPANWQEYNLVILNGVTDISANLGKQIAAAQQQGLSVCIFPARTRNYAALNEGLKQIADISITGIDTAAQTVSTLQQGSALVKDLFERVPDNIQLPQANWHYTIRAGLAANQQSIMSFRNGDPFLAQYTPARGRLYIAATSADIESGNFPGSYYFVPFLYQMAAQSQGSSVYALAAGSRQPAYLPLDATGERNMVHVYGPGIDAIPPQQPEGAGVNVYIDQAVQQPGFYTLAAATGDTAIVPLNTARAESALELWQPAELKKQWQGDNITWLDADAAAAGGDGPTRGGFPLWKVCAILALIMLAIETWMLAAGLRKPTAATT